MISHLRLISVVNYNQETGNFIWLVSRGGSRKGDIAGSLDKRGYIVIGIDYNAYFAHVLAYFYMTEHYPKYPDEQIDHINRIKGDNRWKNLRWANDALNALNCPIQSNNSSGYKGVGRDKRKKETDKCWRAYIQLEGKQKSLGYYHTPEEAARAYDRAAIKYYGEFANTNFLREDYDSLDIQERI